MTSAEDDEGTSGPRNAVVLCGRVSMPATERRLPSGDTIMTTRVVVDREIPRSKGGQSRSKQRFDAIDCVAWSARVQRSVRRWQAGDEVYVEGAIRRRFYRTDKGLASSFEVEIVRARLLVAASRAKATALAATSPGDG